MSRIRANNITNNAGTGAPTFPNGANVTGIVTATSFSGSGVSLTGVDKISEGNTEAEVVDTGSDGHFKVTTEGTERLRINSSGNVGIGTTSPTSLLHVSGTGTVSSRTYATNAAGDAAFFAVNDSSSLCGPLVYGTSKTAYGALLAGETAFYSNNHATIMSDGGHIKFATGGNTEKARIDTSGRLLLGTSTARSNIKFKTNTVNAYVQQESSGSQYSGQSLISYSSGDYNPVLTLGISNSNTLGTNTLVGANWDLGMLQFVGNDGTDFKSAAVIEASVDGTAASGSMPGVLRFSTSASGSVSPTERMRINSSGTAYFNTTTALSSYTTSQGVWISGETVGGQDISSDTLIVSQGDASNANAVFNRTDTGSNTYIIFRVQGSSKGSITTNGTSVAYNTSSDYRLKENVVSLTGAANRLNQLQVHRFNFIADPNKDVDGFIAHEVQAVVPEAISGTKDETKLTSAVLTADGSLVAQGIKESDWESGKVPDEEGNFTYAQDTQWVAEHEVPVYQGIDQSKLVPLLTAALQEALAKIATLEQRLTDAGIA